ncbi:ATP-binding protein [Arthrobacter halodurans]|uniref:Sensor-like histidine kinase SenX3 n=1 Tax=Arthrobacter halodurans TaxID=516699 RepID=A0ABV4UK29_9MICC
MKSSARTRAAWPHAVFAAALALFALLGRATQLPGTGVALVWPAAGVALLWYLWAARRPGHRVPTLAAILAITAGFNYATGLPLQRALLFGVVTAVQALIAHAVLRRWAPPRQTTVRAFFVTACAAIAAAAVGAGIVALAMAAVGAPDMGAAFVAWLVRNGISLCTVASLGLVAAESLPALRRSPPARLAEGAALVGLTAAACAVGFGRDDGVPLFFVTLPFGVWAALRFSALSAYLHAIATGAVLVAITLTGHGPFRELPPSTAAYTAQFYLFVVFVVTALLAVNREESRRLLADLQRSGVQARDEARLRDVVIKTITEGIIVVGSDGRFILQNQTSRDWLGPIPEDVGQWGDEIGVTTASGEKLRGEDLPLSRALRGEIVQRAEMTIPRPGGGERHLSVDAVPLALPGEDSHGAVAVFRDITEDRRQREHLTRFASVVAHDLKTPLTVFDGWLELLEEEGRDAVARERAVASMQRASGKMNRLISDLLTYSLARNGDNHPTVIDVGAMAYAVAEPVVVLARKRGTPVRLDVSARGLVYADRKLLEQLLANLLGNAVKYADPDRPVQIEVASRPADEPGWIAVQVSDNGIGIPDGELEGVFDEFRRASNGMARASGSGLGLAICRRIVQGHGGTITARRGDPHGSVFEFTLPAEPDVDEDGPRPAARGSAAIS